MGHEISVVYLNSGMICGSKLPLGWWPACAARIFGVLVLQTGAIECAGKMTPRFEAHLQIMSAIASHSSGVYAALPFGAELEVK